MSCDPCLSPIVVNIPGPQGATGAAGTNGTNGKNAFTFLTAGTTMPAEQDDRIFNVLDSSWATIGQNVTVQFAGEFEVIAKPSATSITLRNLKNTGTLQYLANIAAGTGISNGAQVSPSGKQGATGAVPAGVAPDTATYITQTPSGMPGQALSTLASGIVKSTTGTGIVSIATPGTDYLTPATGVEIADIGVTVQPKNANLDALAALVAAADQLSYFTGPGAKALTALTAFGRTLLANASAAAARLTLGVRYGLLGQAIALDMNAAGAPVDLPSIGINSSKYIVDRVLATDASISLTTATLGLFGSAGGGVPVICADQALSALTGPTKQKALTISAAGSTDIITSATLVPRLGTAQGAAATINLWVFGYDLS